MIFGYMLQVILYRSGLVTAAASFVVAASASFLPENSLLSNVVNENLNSLYALGAGGLGLSLYLIHIYVTEIKRTLQALWALGVVGSLATYTSLAQPTGQNLIQYVVANPMAVWFVGPLFAALTGLVFKEGNSLKICYLHSFKRHAIKLKAQRPPNYSASPSNIYMRFIEKAHLIHYSFF